MRRMLSPDLVTNVRFCYGSARMYGGLKRWSRYSHYRYHSLLHPRRMVVCLIRSPVGSTLPRTQVLAFG
jgi:hypothetical protein